MSWIFTRWISILFAGRHIPTYTDVMNWKLLRKQGRKSGWFTKTSNKIRQKATQLPWHLCFREPIVTVPHSKQRIRLPWCVTARTSDYASPFALEKKENEHSWEMKLDPTLCWKGARASGSQLRSAAKHRGGVCNENADIIPCSANIFSVWECSELWQVINVFFGRQSSSQKPNWVENQTSYIKKIV